MKIKAILPALAVILPLMASSYIKPLEDTSRIDAHIERTKKRDALVIKRHMEKLRKQRTKNDPPHQQ